MSIVAGQAKLKRASKDLMIAWNEIRASWRDDKSREFDKRYIAPMAAKLRAADAALIHMDGILYRLRRDCE